MRIPMEDIGQKKGGKPLDLEFKKIGKDKYIKYNQLQCLYTYIEFERGENGKHKAIHVDQWHPDWYVKAVLDANVAAQNDWKGEYGADLFTITSRVPIAVRSQLMKQCGFQNGHGYDEKKFRSIMNDRDYYKLKTVPGVI